MQLFLLQFEKFVNNNNMKSASKVRDPKKFSMGDDLCEYLTKVGVPKNKAPPNKNFPKGIQVSSYYSLAKFALQFRSKVIRNLVQTCSPLKLP